jgi:hypothetical protein
VSAPIDVQLYENQRLLGSSQTDRIMVPVGRHDIEVVNEALGYRASKTVNVNARPDRQHQARFCRRRRWR